MLTLSSISVRGRNTHPGQPIAQRAIASLGYVSRHIALFLLLLLGSNAWAQTYSSNPILPDYTADPDILIANGKYYIYTTALETNNVEFHAYSSSDLTNWVDEGVVFNLLTTNWANQQGYAPNVVYRNSKYYFYFSGNERVGVAVGNSPTGPFTDAVGAPLVSDSFNGVNIDQGVFIDDDGQAYLYYGQNTFRIVKLNADMISTNGSINAVTPSGYFEAPYLIKRNSTYYLMWSVNFYTSDDYHVEYATASTPLGPWTAKGRLTSPTSTIKGPGHNAVLKLPGCDEWYFLYHGHTGNLNRRTRIERMYFNADGSIQPVTLTSTGVAARLSSGSCVAELPTPGIVSGGTYKLTHKGTNQCLDALNNSATPGNDVIQYTDIGGDAQRWVITLEADGYYKLTHKATNQCLDVGGNSASPGADVAQWTDNGNDAQRWKIESTGDGYYKLTHKGTDQCLDVLNNSATPGANVIQYTDNGGDAQRWKLELISSGARLAADMELFTLSMKVFPNPSAGHVTLTYIPLSSETVSLSMYNSQGKAVLPVFEGRVEQSVEQRHQVDVKSFQPGLYVFRLLTPTRIVEQKLVVSH